MAARQRVGEALRYGRDRLAAPGSAVREDSPALDAQVLLADLLGVDRVALFAHPERLLAAAQWSAYKTRLHRRAAGEPVAYLTGRKEFMALDFRVDRRVLIPRPATEVLVERALALLPGAGAGLVAADVGTGSGAIAVSLAHLRPGLRVIATDRSLDALAVARANATRLLGHGQSRVRFVCGSLLAPLRVRVHLIAANLPYIPRADLATLPASVQHYEPWPALDGGDDGLSVYRALLRDVPRVLLPGGTLLMECDPRQATWLERLALAALPGARAAVRRDLAGQDRLVEVGTPPAGLRS